MAIKDSAIEYKVNNSRAVALNNSSAANKTCYIDRHGNMWAAFYITNKNINVYYSEDNGFTWNWVTNIAGYSREGTYQGTPLYFLESEALQKIYLVTTNGLMFELDSSNLKRNPEYIPLLPTIVQVYIPSTLEYLTGQDGYRGGLFSLCGDPDSVFYMFYSVTPGNTLKCAEYSMVNSRRDTYTTATELWSLEYKDSGISSQEKIDAVSKDRYCHVAFVDFSDNFKYVKYDKINHSFSTAVTLNSASLYAKDPRIAIDGKDTIVALFGDGSGSDTDINLKMSISSNGGSSFISQNIAKPFNTTVYLDAATGTVQVRADIIANVDGGFLISAIFTNSIGRPTLYVKTISTIGIQGSWKQVNTKDDDITGSQFFRPFNDRLIYFGNYSTMRCAYQVGEGDTEHGNDTVSTSIFQESLTNLAFVEDGPSNSMSIDPLTSGKLRIDFRVIGSIDSNVNYYASNVVGDYSEAYVEAIDKIGVSVKVKSYEPLEVATDTGQGAYENPTQHTTKVVIDPDTYDFPSIAREDSIFTQYIERDIRKVFFKPDFFMHRAFIVNDGGFVKRTIWTLSYVGNEYEISQIVPRFINNEICFYEANAYVIGPSYDPFRKLTLPSET